MDEDHPIFVVGPPRSGSTYLARVLSAHPDILVTGETRVMCFVAQMLGPMLRDKWLIEGERDIFVPVAREHARAMVLDFYRRLNTRDARRWGDKFPHYADPDQCPGCLEHINSLFPGAQFICLVRDPRAVTASVISKSEELCRPRNEGLEEGIDVWTRCISTAIEFSQTLEDGRFLLTRYESLMADALAELERIFTFLGEHIAEEVTAFVQTQTKSPSPMSAPTSNFDDDTFPLRTWQGRLRDGEEALIQEATAALRARLGYSD